MGWVYFEILFCSTWFTEKAHGDKCVVLVCIKDSKGFLHLSCKESAIDLYCSSFIEIQFTCHTRLLLKEYKSMLSSTFTELCNHPHIQFLSQSLSSFSSPPRQGKPHHLPAVFQAWRPPLCGTFPRSGLGVASPSRSTVISLIWRPNAISLYWPATFCLFVYQLADIGATPTFGLQWIMQLWRFMHKFLCYHVFISFGHIPGSGAAGSSNSTFDLLRSGN